MTRVLRRQGQVFERRGSSVDQGVVDRMVHPAARREESAGVPVEEFADYDDTVASTQPTGAPGQGTRRESTEELVKRLWDQERSQYEDSQQASQPLYQQEGRNRLAGYVSNPFEEEGRRQIGRQFWSAPLGGHLRSALAGQEVFGHTITGGQARVAEQAAAGLLATGVGVPMFLEAVRGLTTPQTQGTIPMG